MVLTSLKSSSEVLDVDRWLPQQKAYYSEKTTGVNYEVIVLSVDDELVKVRFRDSDQELTVGKTELQHKTYLWSNYLKAWNKVQPSFTRYF